MSVHLFYWALKLNICIIGKNICTGENNDILGSLILTEAKLDNKQSA